MRPKSGQPAGWGGVDRPSSRADLKGPDDPHPTLASFLVRLQASPFCPYNRKTLVQKWGLDYATAWLDFLEAEDAAGRIRPRANQTDVSRGGLYRWCIEQGEWPPERTSHGEHRRNPQGTEARTRVAAADELRARWGS